MVTRFILLFLMLPSCAFAQDIINYVPPPMFGEAIRKDTPPLPPRRPEKLNPPYSYVQYIRQHGHAPALIKPAPEHFISEDSLMQPDAQDILDQINPQ